MQEHTYLSSLSQTLAFEYGIFIPEDRKTNEMVLEGSGYKMEAQISVFKVWGFVNSGKLESVGDEVAVEKNVGES